MPLKPLRNTQCADISASVHSGLFGKEHSTRQKGPPFVWLVRVTQETSKIIQAIAKVLSSLSELDDKAYC